MSFQEALRYAIRQQREKLTVAVLKAESSSDEVESDDDPESEDEAEIG